MSAALDANVPKRDQFHLNTREYSKTNLIPRLFPFIVSFSRCNAHAQSPDSTSSAEEVSGNIDDVITLARKLLNRAVVSRLVPKQECMVELDKLPLILCSETIESIN